MAPSILTSLPSAAVLIGVDTHKDQHVAVALDRHGAVLGHLQIPATSKGYQTLLEWTVGHGALQPADLLVALEGSGSYGAGLCRNLLAAGCSVREVSRPNRQLRRQHGKDDWIDAEMAARSLLAGTATAEPKASDGPVEMLRLLKSTKDSAVHSRTKAINQLKALLVTVPAALREQLQNLRNKELLQRCAQLRPGAITTPLAPHAWRCAHWPGASSSSALKLRPWSCSSMPSPMSWHHSSRLPRALAPTTPVRC